MLPAAEEVVPLTIVLKAAYKWQRACRFRNQERLPLSNSKLSILALVWRVESL
jgi:hypothetical protein